MFFNPHDVFLSIQILNERQRQAIMRKGFSNILNMTLDALGSRSHLRWLMDKLNHKDITIWPGLGKELKITKEIVYVSHSFFIYKRYKKQGNTSY
jgi:hypothetical protein